jgi:hypothetical protein
LIVLAEEQTVNISGKDIGAVAQKLEEFGKQLPPNEQVVIDWLLERAASAPAERPEDADVSGYLFSSSAVGGVARYGAVAQPGGQTFSQTFNRAVGFGNTAAVTGTFGIRVRGGGYSAGGYSAGLR